jgi:hypothetical protein
MSALDIAAASDPSAGISPTRRTPDKLSVVYVAGSGHTGSTLLAMLLDAHPAIVSVGEIAVKPKIRRRGDDGDQQCSCGATIRECEFWQRVFRRVHQDGFDLGPGRWSTDYRSEHRWFGRFYAHDSGYRVLRQIQRWAAAHLPPQSARMRRTDRVNVSFMRAAMEIAGAHVFCDTTKQTMRLWRLLAIPELDMRVVSLVRDVRGYGASAKRRGHSVRQAALTWRRDQEIIAELAERLPEHRRLLLKYEELCANLGPTLQRLYSFCGVEKIEPTAVVVSKEHHVLGNRIRLQPSIRVRLDDSWRTMLTQQDEHDIMAIAGDLNDRFGYIR